MKKRKKKGLSMLLGVAGLLAALSGCVLFGILHGERPYLQNGISEAVKPAGGEMAGLSGIDEPEQTRIILSQDGSSVSGPGADVSGNTVTIDRGGSYRLSGTLEDGQVYVDAGGKETVELVLDGVDITNLSDAAIHIENAGHTLILLEEGTFNRLQSGAEAEMEAAAQEDGQDAKGGALYARDDLSVTGTGSLQVFGYMNNGIHTTNHLSIDSGNIEVEALNNGIKGKDSVTVTGGSFSIRSGGDGIKSDDSTGDGYGMISIEGGEFSIQSQGDALQAETSLAISDGTFHIIAGGGSGNLFSRPQGSWENPDSGWDLSDMTQASAKGLKCGREIVVTGGSFFVDSYDDAVHSNGAVRILGGSLTLAAGDDGIHGDMELEITGGDIRITKSYEGLEANQISIEGGVVDIVADDDGINANGGPDGGWGWGRENTASKVKDMPNLTICGGEVKVDAGGDGFDSNGNISIEGGMVSIDGPSSNWNGAIDSGSENGRSCTVSGGIILAVGSSGMAETFDGSSTQCSFRHNFEHAYGAGSEVIIFDAEGNELFRHTAAKEMASVVFSSPELVLGETYILSVGGETVEITLDAVSTISGRRGGWGW